MCEPHTSARFFMESLLHDQTPAAAFGHEVDFYISQYIQSIFLMPEIETQLEAQDLTRIYRPTEGAGKDKTLPRTRLQTHQFLTVNFGLWYTFILSNFFTDLLDLVTGRYKHTNNVSISVMSGYCDGKFFKIPKRDFIFARVKTG